jgi:DNA-binding response OmpR family regulator
MKKILIVDDDRGFVRMLGAFLHKEGYDVVAAHDGEQAFRKVREALPDLVILDIVMPNVNGYAFVQDVKKIPGAAEVPVIVLTCKDRLEDLFRVEGVKEYIVKPFDHAGLLEKIRKYI